MLHEQLIIQGCCQLDPVAQKHLYHHFAPSMLRVCIRYASSYEEAQDIMQDGFIKVFFNFNKYEGKGSLEGWLKRIMINTAITHFKKNKSWNEQLRNNITEVDTEQLSLENENNDNEDTWGQYLDLEPKLLLDTIHNLPHVLRIVFNMYFMENMKHKEIAQILKIDEVTSRTRLNRARKMMQQKIENLIAHLSIN